jgi:hypothetical protein
MGDVEPCEMLVAIKVIEEGHLQLYSLARKFLKAGVPPDITEWRTGTVHRLDVCGNYFSRCGISER